MQTATPSTRFEVGTKPKLGNSDFFFATAQQARGSLLDVLETNVKALSDETVSNLLVDDDTDCARGDVPNTTSASMIELVGHAWGGQGKVRQTTREQCEQLRYLCGLLR